MKIVKLVITLLGVAVGVTLVGVLVLRLEPVQRLVQDKLYDNVPSFVPVTSYWLGQRSGGYSTTTPTWSPRFGRSPLTR